MAVSKVTLVNNNVSQTLIDVSNDTAVAADVAQGKTFHLATGEQAVGTASGQSLPTQIKTVAPSTAQQSVTPDSGYSLAEVVVEAVTSSIDSNIIPSNIRQGVNILGVTGTMQEGSGSNATLLSVVDKSITTINENDFAGLTTIGDSAFYRCSQLTGGTLPSTVTSIGDMAFAKCSSLTSTMLNDNVTHVGLGAYQDCTSLTTLEWTSNFNTIPNTCFSNTGFTSVTIPDGVTSLETGCFENCSNLTELTIPSSVTHMADYCLRNNPNLKVVTILATTPPSTDGVNPLGDYSSLDYVKVPDDAVATYLGESSWNQYNIVGVSTPSAVPQAEFHFQENEQEVSTTVDLTQYNNTLPTTVDGKQGSTATYIVIRNIQTLTIPSDFKDNEIYYDGTLQQMSDANIIVPNNVVLMMSLLSDKDSETALMKILVTANDGAKIIGNALFPDGTTTGTGSYIDAQGTLVTSGTMTASYELTFNITENGNTTTVVLGMDENNIVTLTVSA